MAEKKKKKATRHQLRKGSDSAPYWKITAILAIGLCIALIVKILMAPTPVQGPSVSQTSPASPYGSLEETKVQLVASEFECACDHCGKTALMDCSCDRPHGALEEKSFIRRKLQQGHSVEEIIQLVDKKYGHKIT